MNTPLIHSLDPFAYLDQQIFEGESATLFSGHWWLIGSSASLQKKGDYICCHVGKANLFVIRNRDGNLRGFHNICRHRAGPILDQGDGACNGNLLVCQYHGWSYDFSGNLVNAHDLTATVDKASMALKPVRVAQWNQMVFVCLGDNAPSLQSWLGSLAGRVEGFMEDRQTSYQDVIRKTANTNWKCYGDNACEGYHVGMVHKTLGQSANSEKIDLTCEVDGDYVRFDVAYDSADADQTRIGNGLWIYKFPGLLIHCSEFGLNAECVMPVSRDRIEISRWFWTDYAAVTNAGMDAAELVGSASVVMDEDIAICERVFLNLQSGYAERGPLSTKQEPGTIFFQSLVAKIQPAYKAT